MKLFLVVYVDDFKLAGPKENSARGWELIRDPTKANIAMDDPTPADRFLGCLHTLKTIDVKTGFDPRHARIPGDVIKKEPPLMPYGFKVQPCQEYGKPYEPPIMAR